MTRFVLAFRLGRSSGVCTSTWEFITAITMHLSAQSMPLGEEGERYVDLCKGGRRERKHEGVNG